MQESAHDGTPRYPTSLGTSDADSISLLGHDLAGELMGKVGFGELALWLVTQRRPEPGDVRVFEAVLVALADDFWKAVWVLVGLVAYQQLENLVIAPKVTSKTMAIHPAVSVGAIIVGGTLMGATGVVLALPVAAIIQAVISTTIDRHQVIAEAEDVTDDPGSGSTPLADRDHSGE